MSGASYSTGRFRAINRLEQPVKIRLFGFMAVTVFGGLLLTWITRNTWDQLERLQKEHAAVRSESFYLGVSLRGNIRSVNEELLQFGHSPDSVLREEVLRQSSDLKGWLMTNRVQLAELAKLPLLKQVLIDDFEILDEVQTEYERYLGEVTKLLEPGAAASGDLSFQERYKQVRRASTRLLGLCDELVKAQREDFSDFLLETQSNLVNHQRLLKLTLALIATLAGALAVLVYRGMITPLRVGLSESKSIIERQEKLASLGVLASGVAHEIRNPLTAIKFRLFSFKKSAPGLGENEDLTLIGDEINRLERIVKDFLQFARPSEPAMAQVPARQLLVEVTDLLKGQLERAAVQLRLEDGAGLWVHADGQQLKQVLINLVQNSVEAIGRNGTITLTLRRDEAELEGRVRAVAILAVTDTGGGISTEVQSRLFDPFFTTKEGGTGLGLAIAARIVQKHGGVLRYDTELNCGTTFEVVLPEVEIDATNHPAH